MPSTPRCHEIPQGSIHSCLETNWNPESPVSKDDINQIVIAPVAADESRATIFGSSGRDFGISATISAPTIGTSTIAVRIGNARVPASDANITESL